MATTTGPASRRGGSRPSRPTRAASCRSRLRRLCRAAFVAGLVCSTAAEARAQTAGEQQALDVAPHAPLVFRAFGAIDWGATQRPDTPNSFTLGQLDIFMTSALNDRVSVLAEVVLEAGTNTRVVTDLERLVVTFRFNDYLRLSAGRFHTGVGYYNTAFHHAAFFETTAERPRIYQFEDEGGVLPVHEVGLSLRGEVPGTDSAFHYLAEIGNGRRWSEPADEAHESLDDNTAKSVNVGVAFQPEAWRGLEVGVSHYRDTIPRPSLSSVPHRVTATYLVYRTRSVQAIAEWLWLTHEVGATRYDNSGGYLQLSRAWGKFRPYYRYERQTIDPETPFIGDEPSLSAHVAGLRADPMELLGLKVEYQRADEASYRGLDSFRVQLAFVF